MVTKNAIIANAPKWKQNTAKIKLKAKCVKTIAKSSKH